MYIYIHIYFLPYVLIIPPNAWYVLIRVENCSVPEGSDLEGLLCCIQWGVSAKQTRSQTLFNYSNATRR